jgi:hypothetical protein|nr:hypothetical protein [Streptomyces sp. OV198]
MLEERADCRRVQIGDAQAGRPSAGALLGEAEQEGERVPVGRDGVLAGLKLEHQFVGEEAL